MRFVAGKYFSHFCGVIFMVHVFLPTVLGAKKFSPKLQKYIEVLKEKLKNSGFGDIAARSKIENTPLSSSTDRMPEVMPDGFLPKIAVGPGKPPKQLHLARKREGDPQQEYGMTCKDNEWFVFVDDLPACVNPVWDGGYDPTFCAKMKNGWIYCGCSDDDLLGMKEGVDTCIDKQDLTHGWCHLGPCPSSFKCVENVENKRYDCVKENLKVPIWY